MLCNDIYVAIFNIVWVVLSPRPNKEKGCSLYYNLVERICRYILNYVSNCLSSDLNKERSCSLYYKVMEQLRRYILNYVYNFLSPDPNKERRYPLYYKVMSQFINESEESTGRTLLEEFIQNMASYSFIFHFISIPPSLPDESKRSLHISGLFTQ